MIFKIPGSTWGIVLLSPMISIKWLRSSGHGNQRRTAHDVFVCIFCGIWDAFLFWSSFISFFTDNTTYAKIRFLYFLRKTIMCQKKLFVAVHDYMKSPTKWSNTPVKWSKQRNKESQTQQSKPVAQLSIGLSCERSWVRLRPDQYSGS